jgi:hypothetical protein
VPGRMSRSAMIEVDEDTIVDLLAYRSRASELQDFA